MATSNAAFAFTHLTFGTGLPSPAHSGLATSIQRGPLAGSYPWDSGLPSGLAMSMQLGHLPEVPLGDTPLLGSGLLQFGHFPTSSFVRRNSPVDAGFGVRRFAGGALRAGPDFGRCDESWACKA